MKRIESVRQRARNLGIIIKAFLPDPTDELFPIIN
jgi:hypothetical protein